MLSKHDQELVTLFAKTTDDNLMENLLSGILTPGERAEIAQRLQIIKLLLDGMPQAKIAKDLGVGIATVTRGSRAVKSGYFKVLQQKNNQKITEHSLRWRS